MRNFIFIFSFFIATAHIYAQDFSNQWVGHYSYFQISDLFATDTDIYAASENALFVYNVAAQTSETFSTVNGLSGETISAIYYSSLNDAIVVGYENGLVEIILNNNDVRTFVDIVEKPTISPTQKRINHFLENEGTLFISTSFGIVEFDLENLEFGDTFFIGPAGSQINVTSVAVLDNTIYASAPGSGFYTADRSNPSLVDFNQWTLLESGNFNAVLVFNNDIIVHQNDDLIRRLEGSTFNTLITAPSLILDVVNNTGNLTISLVDQSVVYDQNYQEVSIAASTTENTFSLSSSITLNDKLFLGTENAGLLQTDITNTADKALVSPNGPLRNDPFRIEALNDNLWVVYGVYNRFYNPFPLQQRGVSHLNADTWINIANTDLFGASSLSHIAIDPNNNSQVFISSFQDGLLEINDNVSTALYNTSNSDFETIVPDQEVIRLNGSAFDSNGDLWVTSSLVNTGINRYSPDDGQVLKINMSSVVPPESSDLGYSDLDIDRSGNVFAGTFRNGVVAYNPDTGQFAKIVDNLPVTQVDAIAIDRNDQIWIGTREGLRVFFNSSGVFQQSNPQTNQIIILDNEGVPQELLFEQFITDIEVDGSNNKWVATESSGVFYFSSDGQETLAHFTKDNSPLPDNGVLDVSVDDSTGSVYFATSKGLLEFKGTATGPESNLENVIAFPNPVRPGFSGRVTIKGLTTGANVKITDIEGNLVYEEVSEGGSIQWDTTAFGRHKVASGVYLILVTGEDQAETTVSKLLIVR